MDGGLLGGLRLGFWHHALAREGLQKSFLRIRHPIKSMAYELFIGEKLSFAEVSKIIELIRYFLYKSIVTNLISN